MTSTVMTHPCMYPDTPASRTYPGRGRREPRWQSWEARPSDPSCLLLLLARESLLQSSLSLTVRDDLNPRTSSCACVRGTDAAVGERRRIRHTVGELEIASSAHLPTPWESGGCRIYIT